VPASRVLFGFERKREVRIEVEDIVAEVRRGYVKFTLRELQEGATTALTPGQGLKASEKHENGNNDEYQTDASRGGIAPVAAEGPPRECSEECQDQKNDQYSANHDLLLLK
jgi:hypothetical protein